MSAGIVFHLLAAIAYGVLAISLWRPLSQGGGEATAGKVGRICLLSTIVLQGIALQQSLLVGNGVHLGLAPAVSAALWLGMIVFWVESLLARIDSLLLILLPVVAVVCLLSAIFPETHAIAHASSDWLRLHLLIALSAYGLITVAALHAVLMTALDRHLHRPVVQAAHGSSPIRRALDSMPPLLVQEHLLFRLIWIGFAVLTLAVISGTVVSMRLLGVPFPLDHKTIFTLLSWFTFGGLLVGRYVRGWRGRIALRWTLVGFVFLLLAYTGSRFVLEVVLQRS
ncbi:MAG: hypothetical protein EPN41_05170 [Candidimonas sp.]|nr:MAG: hypothetical protein EPN41_05170 [Candidimonas sp.]